MTREQILSCALDIGEQMLISGAEVGRVEAAIRFIGSAYGCKRTDVFTITSSIVVTVQDENGDSSTQTRRITGTRTDLDKLHKLNDLSREICADTPEYTYVQQKLQVICRESGFPLWVEVLSSGLIAFSFAVFFGGSWLDGAVAGALGLCLRLLTWVLQRAGMNQIFTNLVASFGLCLTVLLAVGFGIGDDMNKIIIGNIMLLIPGIALTNSLRDMISGDIMTGMLRFFDAMLVAASIAAGYILAAQLVGGVL